APRACRSSAHRSRRWRSERSGSWWRRSWAGLLERGSGGGTAQAVWPACFASRLALKSAMAALMASSASTEQWIFTGGRDSSRATSLLEIFSASSTERPLTHSVTSDDEAIAEPQPKVLKIGRASCRERV